MKLEKKRLGSFTVQYDDGKIYVSNNKDDVVATFTGGNGFVGSNPLFDAFVFGLLQIDEDLTIWNDFAAHYTVCNGSIYLVEEKRYAE